MNGPMRSSGLLQSPPDVWRLSTNLTSPPIVTLESPPDYCTMSSFEWRSICPTTQRGNFNGREHQRTCPEEKASPWIRDEPMDTDTGDDHFPSVTAALVNGHCGEPSGRSEEKMESGRSQCFSEGSFPWGRSSGLSGDFAAQLEGSSTPASLFAQLRSVRMKECVIREAILRHGGGNEGFRGVIKDIMLWLEARNRINSDSGDSCISQSESLSPPMEQIDYLPWYDAKPRIVVDIQSGSIGNFNHALPADLKFMMNTTSSIRDDRRSCDLTTECSGSGEYGEVLSPEDRLWHPVIDEPRHCGPRSGLQLQGSGLPQKNISSLSSWNLVTPILQDENENCAESSSPDLSPDCSGLDMTDDRSSLEDNLTHWNKIRRHSPFPLDFSSYQSSTELPIYESAETPPVSEIGWTSDIFDSVEANYPPSPGDPCVVNSPRSPPTDSHSSDFTLFGMHRPILIDKTLGRGASPDAVYGCGLVHKLGYFVSPVVSVNLKTSGVPLEGVLAKSKASPGACRWMVRKNRMRRHKTVSRDAFQSSARFTGKTKRMRSLDSVQTLLQSRISPACESQACWIDNRADQEHLLFLLQKVLRPSDVGNLGRIVLPKEHSENHLPWLSSKEGIKFAAEDYDTGETINLRYRFWPNNKSRMYLLENTGGFVRKHNLQESDRMLIYKNQQRGIYVIRARKAQDCVPIARPEAERAEIIRDDSPGDSCMSGTSLCDKDVEIPESKVGSKILESALESVTVATVLREVTLPDDFLILDAMLRTPLDKGTANPVQFPHLGHFDVELLELGNVLAD